MPLQFQDAPGQAYRHPPRRVEPPRPAVGGIMPGLGMPQTDQDVQGIMEARLRRREAPRPSPVLVPRCRGGCGSVA